MTMMNHHKTVCRACFKIVAQCRCPSPDKRTTYVDKCSECQKPRTAIGTELKELETKISSLRDDEEIPKEIMFSRDLLTYINKTLSNMKADLLLREKYVEKLRGEISQLEEGMKIVLGRGGDQ